ncbi:hypothetical protein BJ138DRAFT_1121069 [Hygrophoropsis aurantiaca]|uniref:Uncharacterized protein n=1 Tax=Hygrophoropsis aurantiaca TaxID=72124 RepID=A0ACB7ZQ48_9AGAM|nr:hypothetical protein BJ138DRAFT_1121069 [Hygrophoropsis aurantiaca]
MSKRTCTPPLPSSKRVKLMDQQPDAQSDMLLPTQDPRLWDILSGLVNGDYVPVDTALRAYLGHHYQHTDWKDIIDRLLAVSDPDIRGDPTVIFAEARDKALGHTNTASQELPGMTMYDPTTGARVGYVLIDTVDDETRNTGKEKQTKRGKAQGRRSVSRERCSQYKVSRFLDIEAQDDDDEDDEEEDKDTDEEDDVDEGLSGEKSEQSMYSGSKNCPHVWPFWFI